MALPANLSTRTVTGTFIRLDTGGGAVGTITFEPSVPSWLLDPSVSTVLVPNKLIFNLDSNGAFSQAIPCTNDPQIQPLSWVYKVTVVAGGMKWELGYLAIPEGVGSLDISAIAPVAPPTSLVGQVKSVNGVFPDVSGNVALATIPPTNLDNLADVDAPLPSDGQALVWNTASSKWIPGSGSADSAARAAIVSSWPYDSAGQGTIDARLDRLDGGVNGIKPYAHAYQTTLQSVPAATRTAINMQAEHLDTISGHSTSSLTSRYTPNKAGWYRCTGQLAMADAVGNGVLCQFYKNGSPSAAGNPYGAGKQNYGGFAGNTAQCHATFNMNGTSDFIEMYAEHASAGAINTLVQTNSGCTSYWIIEWVGP